MLSAGVLGDYLSKRRAQGVPLWASDSARKQRECVAPLPELFFTPQPHRKHTGSHGTLTTVPQLWVSSSPLASCAQPDPSLCQQTGVLTGNLPGPQSHSQTPAASKLRVSPIPFSIHSQCSRLSRPHGMAPPSAGQTPQLQGATGNPRIPSSEPHPSC